MNLDNSRDLPTVTQILAACAEEYRATQEIPVDVGNTGTGLTRWVGPDD